MGIDYTNYLGPYVVCKVGMVTKTRQRLTCMNPKCVKYRSERWDTTKFCGHCGQPVMTYEEPRQIDSVDSDEVDRKMKGALHQPGGEAMRGYQKENHVHLWLSNKCIPDQREFSTDPMQDFEVSEITGSLIQQEMIAFRYVYEVELNILRDVYGEANVEVKWGMLQYAH